LNDIINLLLVLSWLVAYYSSRGLLLLSHSFTILLLRS